MDKKTIMSVVTIGATVVSAVASVVGAIASGKKADMELTEKVQEAVANLNK